MGQTPSINQSPDTPRGQSPDIRRCAIYTRKSSEEGLEQSFNSLHAQREACEAYIKSQAHEGWRMLAQAYDDGGFSGGSMERPGLAALLNDLERGEIEIVVVYKVDRLTRSLSDFARIVEAFDRKHVSFVSVTQAFNTTTSMGRLTLNVLLSFAQFEREVTGERIRDKIAASKKKGMWMGGNLPLGYDRQGNTLVINPIEADQVAAIFARYLEVGSVDLLRTELTGKGIRSKTRITRSGKTIGGAAFSRGALYHLLSNAVYLGQIRHKDAVHPGLHPPIMGKDLFDAVQRTLAAQRVKRNSRPFQSTGGRLTGRIVSESGIPFTPSFSYGRGRRVYRYYIAAHIDADADAAANTNPNDHAARSSRLPAKWLEAFVLETLVRLAGRPTATWDQIGQLLIKIEVRRSETHLILDANLLFGTEHPEFAWERLRSRLTTGEQAVPEAKYPDQIRIRLPIALCQRHSQVMRPTANVGTSADGDRSSRADAGLIAGLRKAHGIWMEQGVDLTRQRFDSKVQASSQSYHRKLSLLALLAPDLQRSMLDGSAPNHITLQSLIDRDPPPLLWQQQALWLSRSK